MAKFCVRCGAQGGRPDRKTGFPCGFRSQPGSTRPRLECRRCENEARAASRASLAVPPPLPTPRQAPAVIVRPSPRPAANRLTFVTSDEHVPYQDQNCQNAINALANELRPTGWIINGDGLDLLEISRHSAGSLAKLEGRRLCVTWEEANRWLDGKRDAAGDQCVDWDYVEGNHEDRIRRWLEHADHGVFADDEVLSLERRLRLSERGIELAPGGYPEGGVRLGHLWVTHGRFTNKYHAAKMLDYYRHSVMYGHTHAHQVFYSSAFGGAQVAIGTGHLADVDSPAMSYAPKPNNWVQGFAIVDTRPDGSFNAQPINFWNGQFSYAGKSYGEWRPGKTIIAVPA